MLTDTILQVGSFRCWKKNTWATTERFPVYMYPSKCAQDAKESPVPRSVIYLFPVSPDDDRAAFQDWDFRQFLSTAEGFILVSIYLFTCPCCILIKWLLSSNSFDWQNQKQKNQKAVLRDNIIDFSLTPVIQCNFVERM